MKTLLIAYHSQTGRSQALADAAYAGALVDLDPQLRVDFCHAREVCQVYTKVHHCYDLFLNRYESFPVSTISQW